MPQPASPISSRAIRDTSEYLFAQARLGNSGALNLLVGRYLPRLRRWAHGRLPRWARFGTDTSDLVHDVMLRAIPKIGTLDQRWKGALAAYLQQSVRNRLNDEHRRVARRAVPEALSDAIDTSQRSPLDYVMSREQENRYRAALADLSADDRELIVGHLEFDYTHEQLGCMTGRTPNAARMALQRAMRRLVERMRDG